MTVDSMPVHDRSGARKRPRLAVFGASLDVGNRGVRALGVSVAQLLARTRPEAEIVFHYGNATGGVRQLESAQGTIDVHVQNCRMSPRSAPGEHTLLILMLAALHRLGIRGPAKRNAWLRSLLDSEFIGEIRGGDSFSDIYGLRRFIEGSIPLISAVLLGREYAMLPQTYGPFESRLSRRLARALLRRSSRILTRDRHCTAIVEELSGRTPEFCPDVAFTMEAIEPRALEISPTGFRFDGTAPVIGVNVSGLLYMGGYTGANMFGLRGDYRELVDRLVDTVLASTSATVLLVPHVFGSEQEEEACAALLAAFGPRYPGRVFSVTKPLSEREIKWVIGRTDFFVGSRMHGCIAALSQFVPAVGLAYSDKFLGVFQSAGVGDAIVDLRSADTPFVIERTLAALEDRAQLRKKLEERIPGVREQVAEVFRALLSPPQTP